MTDTNDSLARTISSTLWKGYEELSSAISSSSKSKGAKLSKNQIDRNLSKREDKNIKNKKHDVLE